MNIEKKAGWTGLEPATSCVTGRHSNQLNYHPDLKLFCKHISSTILMKEKIKFLISYTEIHINSYLNLQSKIIEPVCH